MIRHVFGLAGLWLAGQGVGIAAAPLDWLGGHWCGQMGDSRIEEFWTAPAGGTLVGMSRTTGAGGMESFEYMRIEIREGKPHFLAQPGGSPPTAFALDAQAAQSATFRNPAHDFPQTVRYWREGAALRAEIAGPDGKGGEQAIGFTYQRCPASG